MGLLVGGARNVPDRHRTLRATITWSYDLLSEGARRFLAGCSVFRDGIGLASITTVCQSTLDLGVPVRYAVQELVDHSLVRPATVSGTVRPQAVRAISTSGWHRFASRSTPLPTSSSTRDAD